MFIAQIVNAQVYNGFWQENFDGMNISQSPSDDWISTGGFNVLGSPHGDTTFSNTWVNGLSCNLNAITLSDSVFTPKITGHGQFTSAFGFKFRICNWSGGIPVSPTNLSAGDTCYISIYKYIGSFVSDKKILSKIHSGTYTPQMGFTNVGITLINNLLPSDTFRLAIHVKKAVLGDYWYDFDDCGTFYLTSVKEINNNLSHNLFPNPAKNDISFKLDEIIERIQLTNIYGQSVDFNSEINNEGCNKIHFNPSLASGVYFITVKTDKRTVNSKFIKD